MSHQLINLNPDLKQLRDEVFCIGIMANHLVVKNIPYVNSAGEIKHGMLISQLDMAGERTVKPKTHVAMFAGEHPCDANGAKLSPTFIEEIHNPLPTNISLIFFGHYNLFATISFLRSTL